VTPWLFSAFAFAAAAIVAEGFNNLTAGDRFMTRQFPKSGSIYKNGALIVEVVRSAVKIGAVSRFAAIRTRSASEGVTIVSPSLAPRVSVDDARADSPERKRSRFARRPDFVRRARGTPARQSCAARLDY
jgi:hypothetical protein